MSDGPSQTDEFLEASAPRPRRRRTVTVIVCVLVLLGAGVGSAIAVSGAAGGGSTPAGAVNALLTAAQNSDLLGALDAVAPGERSAVEPGFLTLVHELQRLDVLAPAANPSHVAGISLHFRGIETRTRYLDSAVAAVTITRGTVTGSADLAKLPLGSFVTGLAGNLLRKTSARTGSAATGKSSIVTVKVNGTWNVSLGSTIAVDALTSSGASAALPSPTQAVHPVGADSPKGAVSALLDSIAAFDLKGLIADLAPGEMGALQSYAPLFLDKGTAALSLVRSLVTAKFTGLVTSTQPFGAMTLVKVNSVGLTLGYRGITISIAGRCATTSFRGQARKVCSSPAQVEKLLNLFPPATRSLVERLQHARPDSGLATVEVGGKWFVSPIATVFQSINAVASLLEPQDLRMIATFARDPAAIKKAFMDLERSLLRRASSSGAFG